MKVGKLPKLRFSLIFMLRVVVYCALVALCVRLYWQSWPVNQALTALKQEGGLLSPQTERHLVAEGAVAIPALLEELQEGDVAVQVKVLHALEKLQADIAPTVPAIIEKLHHPEIRVRRAAAQALGSADPANDAAFEAIIMALRDDDEVVRLKAIKTLSRLELRRAFLIPRFGYRPVVVSAIADMLHDTSPAVRRVSAEELEDFGAWTTAAAPALMEALKDEDPDVRAAARRSLQRIDPQAWADPE